MSSEFLRDVRKVVNQFGVPLTPETDPYQHAFYLREAKRAGNELPQDAVLGKIVYLSTVLESIPTQIQLSMLNESFGMMPESDRGYFCGLLTIQSNGVVNEDDVTSKEVTFSLLADINSDGTVDVSAAGKNGHAPEFKQKYMDELGFSDLEPEKSHIPSGYETTIYAYDLKGAKLNKMSRFIVNSFENTVALGLPNFQTILIFLLRNLNANKALSFLYANVRTSNYSNRD